MKGLIGWALWRRLGLAWLECRTHLTVTTRTEYRMAKNSRSTRRALIHGAYVATSGDRSGLRAIQNQARNQDRVAQAWSDVGKGLSKAARET